MHRELKKASFYSLTVLIHAADLNIIDVNIQIEVCTIYVRIHPYEPSIQSMSVFNPFEACRIY